MWNPESKEYWNQFYVRPLFDKWKEIPSKLKYKFILKDYTRMFGSKREAELRMKYMYDDTETFIFAFDNAVAEFSKVVKNNILKAYFQEIALDEHYQLIKSGMFYEFFPTLSGNWLQDKDEVIKFITIRENNKEYIKLIF